MEDVVDLLQKAELLGEEILDDKRRIINLDKQRHKNREAIRAMSRYSENKLWISYANMFIKMDKGTALAIIQKDQKVLDATIDEYRDGLKVKVNDLRKMEGKPELQGYNLVALDKKELNALKDIVPDVILSDI